MALPRLADLTRQPVRFALAAALAILFSATMVAAGAVFASDDTELAPASRLPLARPARTRTDRAPGVPVAPLKSPCPHPHKCGDGHGAAPRP